MTILMIGTGGHAQQMFAHIQEETPDLARLLVWIERSEYQGPESLLGQPVLREGSAFETWLQTNTVQGFYFGLGMVKATPERWKVFKRFVDTLTPLSFIHSTATVAQTATLGQGVFVGPQAVVQPFATIGSACVINTGAIVEHHAQVADNCHIAPGAVLCGEVQIGAHTHIGANATVLQRLTVGKEVTVGSMACVTKPVESGQTTVGIPAKTIY